MGTNQSQASIQSQIWSLSIKFGPPALWVTINPSNMHDLIAQGFCGEETNMDHFDQTVGPNMMHHMENLVCNPYGAAHFFHFVVKTTLEKLLGVENGRDWVWVNGGILGNVQAHIGVVKSQNQAMLHLHMLLWMQDMPSSDKLKELFKSEEFHTKIQTYLKHNIWAHFLGINRESIKDIPCKPDLAWSRPLDPRSPTFDEDYRDMEKRLMWSNQIHMCCMGACLSYYDAQQSLSAKEGLPGYFPPKTAWMQEGIGKFNIQMAMLTITTLIYWSCCIATRISSCLPMGKIQRTWQGTFQTM